MEIFLRILAITIRQKWRLAGAYASMLGATVAYLILPHLFGDAIDRVAEIVDGVAVPDREILSIAALVLVVGTAHGILSFGQTYFGEGLAQSVVYRLRNTFYDHVQRLSFAFHDRNHTGNLMSRAITDVESIRMFVNMGLVRTPYFLILFVFVTIILLRLDWRLGVLALGSMFASAILASVVRLRLRLMYLHVQEELAELNTILQENLTGVRVVKAFASEDFEVAKFDAKNADVSRDMVKASRLQALNASVMTFMFLVAMGVVLWYGGWRVINGHITWGELAQVLFYMQVLTLPVRQAGMLVGNFARALAAGQRLFEVLDTESLVQESPTAVDMPRVRGRVRFEDVSFGYGSGSPVLRNIDLDAEPGQAIALLGAPGSGKSTLVHLLPRFYDVTSGRITIDGLDVRDSTLTSLRRNIGIVQQDVFLFAASIRDNIAYGRHDASMDEIVDAARVAQLDAYIRTLPEGYETVIGERGVTLSGGQRQRLSIARAVLVDPPILILDDSTSSVDASTEEQIRKAMESVMRGRTTFVIAHRLTTVHNADQILVVSDGEIVERGTHKDLLAAGGQYRKVYDLQLRPQEEVMLDYEVTVTAGVEGTR